MGDYGKYVGYAYPAVNDLLSAYLINPDFWSTFEVGIPESNNGTPDILDEVKYELDWLLKIDEQRNARQIQLVDAKGRSSAWTGEDCNDVAGHLCDENFSVAGNWLKSTAVLDAMAEAFRQSDPSWKIGRRVLTALVAGEAAGWNGASF